MSPAPAALLLAALAAAALLADRIVSVAAIALVLLLVCLRAPGGRRRMYLVGALGSGLAVFVLTPFVSSIGWHVIWSGPTVPVLGQLDITREELRIGLFQGLRLTAVALAFAAYALLLDHDRLVQSVRFARRSVLAMALATRLVPTLERDAAGLVEALRGRGVEVSGARGRARLLAPLLAGSLERALNLAEAMEARGYGRPGGTRTPRPPAGAGSTGPRSRSALRLWRSECCGSSDRPRARVHLPRRARGAARRLARARAGRGGRAARAFGRRQVDAAARAGGARAALPRRPLLRVGRGRRAGHAPRAPVRPRRHGGDALPGSGGPGRLHAREQRGRVRAREPRHAAGADPAACARRRWPRSAPRISPSGRSPSSRAASCSASASPRCSRSSRGCCCSTSRPRSSTPKAPRPRSSSRGRAAPRSSSPSSGPSACSTPATACCSSRTAASGTASRPTPGCRARR